MSVANSLIKASHLGLIICVLLKGLTMPKPRVAHFYRLLHHKSVER